MSLSQDQLRIRGCKNQARALLTQEGGPVHQDGMQGDTENLSPLSAVTVTQYQASLFWVNRSCVGPVGQAGAQICAAEPGKVRASCTEALLLPEQVRVCAAAQCRAGEHQRHRHSGDPVRREAEDQPR